MSYTMTSKASRKTRRVAEKVKVECGIEVLLEAGARSRHLLVCNAGLMSGMTYERLAEIFLEFGGSTCSVERIDLLPRRSYSFVTYKSDEDAERAYQNIHGNVSPKGETSGDLPLYLAFVHRLPSSPSSSSGNLFGKPLPEGLRVIEDFVSEEEEEAILGSLAQSDPAIVDLKHRHVTHYGYDFVYGSNSIDHDSPNGRDFPSLWTPFLNRALSLGYVKVLPDQCTVNRYEPGQGIPPHVDTHSCCDDVITSLSLGSDTVMNFAHPEREDVIPVVLPRRSLLVMSGEARYVYSHGISTRSTDVVPRGMEGLTLKNRCRRTSLTFRKTLRGRPCTCIYASSCDSQKSSMLQLTDGASAKALENEHVHSVYEEIAEHFSETRHKPWPKVLEFVDSLPECGILIDVGCGNGKYLGHNKNQTQIACDYSQGLVSICRQRGFNGIRCDCLHLPLKTNCADGIICIAVIHHLSTEKRRLRALEEMCRVLVPGGRCLIYAWAKDQQRDQKPSAYLKKNKVNEFETEQEVKMPMGNVPLPLHTNRTNFQHSDVLVPWTRKGQEEKTFHRFYHVFKETELEDMVKNVSDFSIEKSYYDQGNWCVILKKCCVAVN